MPPDSLATDKASSSQSFTLPAAEIKNAIGRLRASDPYEIAFEAIRQQHRDGHPGVWEDDPDDYRGACDEADWRVASDALAAHGFDPASPEMRDIILDAQNHVEELEPGLDFDSFDARAGLRVLNAPDYPTYHEPIRRPLTVRQGRERRSACNTRSKGSRRGAATSRAGPDDGDPDLDGESDGPPRTGPLHAARIGGAR